MIETAFIIAALAFGSTASATETTVAWPSNICPLEGLQLDLEPTIQAEAPRPEDEPPPSDTPVFEILDPTAEDVDAPAEPFDETIRFLAVPPWRARYYPDGAYDLWYDARCVPDGWGMEIAEPGSTMP